MSSKLFEITCRVIPKTFGIYAVGIGFFVISTWLALRVPVLVERVLDLYVANPENTELMVRLATTIMLIGAGIMVARTASRLFVLWCGRIIESHLRDEYFGKALRFQRPSIEQFKVGDLISRLTTEARQIGFFYGFGMVQLINLVLTIFFSLRYMLGVHTTLTIVTYVPILFQLLASVLTIPRIFRYSKIQQKKQAELSESISESFYHIHALHSEGCIESFFKQISLKNRDLQRANNVVSVFRYLVLPSSSLVAQLSHVIVLVYGAHLVMDNIITVGQVAAFQSYIALQAVPFLGFGLFVAVRARAKAAAERFKEIDQLALDPLAGDAPLGSWKRSVSQDAQSTNRLQPRAKVPLIKLSGVSFSYPGQQVLDKLDLTVWPNEHLQIIGKIGSGKTTLFKVLMKLYEPSAGEYFWHGESMKDATVIEMRKRAGFVTQDNHFFAHTIAHNLCSGLYHLGNSDALQKRMVEATQAALIYDEIQGFDKGFATEIGEGGVRLSGGQKNASFVSSGTDASKRGLFS